MLVRPLELKDLKHVIALCHQFGYPASNEEIEQRLDTLQQLREHKQ